MANVTDAQDTRIAKIDSLNKPCWNGIAPSFFVIHRFSGETTNGVFAENVSTESVWGNEGKHWFASDKKQLGRFVLKMLEKNVKVLMQR